MKKISVLIIALLAIFLMAGTAFAEDIGWSGGAPVHKDFTITTSDGCAACHVTHTANVAKLLYGASEPTTQTGFCYVCHAGTIASPYDVDTGTIDDGTAVPSTAGSFQFLEGTDSQITSMHSVEDLTTAVSADLAAADIPGNKLTGDAGTISGGFKCASCHDPHAGDKPNDRLLKEQPLSGNSVVDDVDFVFNSDLSTKDYASSAAANTALNNWCGQCHGIFDKSGASNDDSGKVLTNGDTMFRHPMDVDVNPSTVVNAVYLGYKTTGLTAATGRNLLNCLTCHKAHGTEAEKGAYSWKRETSVSGEVYGDSSALLRMNARGVCFDCHGAATKNQEDYTTIISPTGNK